MGIAAVRQGLLAHQQRWVADRAGFKAVEKSRRVGISWAEAYDAVLHAGSGRGNVYYQSYDKDMTRGFIDDCASWAESLGVRADEVGESLLPVGDSGAVQVFRLGLAAGREIRAMTSAPRAFRSRGRPGDRAIVDEAAFVADLGEVLKAALAFRQWGGEVRVISTHNGAASPFAALCRDLRSGAAPGSIHRVTLGDALNCGLYKRICRVRGVDWTAEAEAEWEAGLRAEYGAAAAEELDCVPAAGAGAWLAWETVRAAEDPALATAGGRPAAAGPVYVGVDVARRRDLWVACVVEAAPEGLRLIELAAERDATFSEQAVIVARMVRDYRPVRVAVDRTGMGEAVVERLQEAHGRLRVEGVLMTGPRRLDVATALREAFEDRRIRIPADEALRRDLHSVRAEPGPTGAPRLAARRGSSDGHADRFWALALAVAAARGAARAAQVRVTGGVHAALAGGSGYVVDGAAGVVLGPLAGVRIGG